MARILESPPSGLGVPGWRHSLGAITGTFRCLGAAIFWLCSGRDRYDKSPLIWDTDMPRKHTLPPFLAGSITDATYERWLHRKASAHVRRDRERGHTCTPATYKEAIHAAVLASSGRDHYTGEQLDWSLISTYKNEDSQAGRHAYKLGFALLPTVDHVSASATEASFKICAWRTNDAKNDLSVQEFVALCRRVLEHQGFMISMKSADAAPDHQSREWGAA